MFGPEQNSKLKTVMYDLPFDIRRAPILGPLSNMSEHTRAHLKYPSVIYLVRVIAFWKLCGLQTAEVAPESTSSQRDEICFNLGSE